MGGQMKYKIISCDADSLAAGLYRTYRGYIVPRANEDGYIKKIIDICKEEDIDAVFGGTDPEVVELAKNKKNIELQTNAKVICSSYEAVMIGFDKWETFKFLKENGFSTALTVFSKDADEILKVLDFPMIVKPRKGSASVGLFICTNKKELEYALTQEQEMICQEYLYGHDWEQNKVDKRYLSKQVDEYSTEVFVDKEGKVRGSITNWRTMKKGIPFKAIINEFREINIAARRIVAVMPGVVGPVNLQCRKTTLGPTFFEINTRFSGSTAVRCVAGFNGPHLAIKNFIKGEQLSREDFQYKNLVEIRWENELYIKKNDYKKLKKQGVIQTKGKVINYF